MDFPSFLAMTAAEFAVCTAYPGKIAYMSCHYSSSGTGTSGIPRWLPPGSVLMLTDEYPPNGHDPGQVVRELADAVKRLECSAVVLDLQRPDLPENRLVAEAAVSLPCPVAVSRIYSEDLSCGILLPPPPLWTPLPEYLAPWQGRSLWLEAYPEGATVTVTEKGSTYTPSPFSPLTESFHSRMLHIDYRPEIRKDRVIFHLRRSRSRMIELLRQAGDLGVKNAIGLYQQENAPL